VIVPFVDIVGMVIISLNFL